MIRKAGHQVPAKRERQGSPVTHDREKGAGAKEAALATEPAPGALEEPPKPGGGSECLVLTVKPQPLAEKAIFWVALLSPN